jgi:hypothetical protein
VKLYKLAFNKGRNGEVITMALKVIPFLREDKKNDSLIVLVHGLGAPETFIGGGLKECECVNGTGTST